MTYSEGRPWAVAIKEEILARRMPPWGAVKGFGEFRNDQALTPEQLELVVSWVDGGVPEGEDKDLPAPPKFSSDSPVSHQHGEIPVSGDTTLKRAFLLDGLIPTMVPDDASFQIIAQLPDGSLEPLLWLSHYKTKYGHAFLLRTPLQLPAGTVIRGVPKDSPSLCCRLRRRRLLQLFHRNIKVDRIHNALPLELHPHPVHPRPREF